MPNANPKLQVKVNLDLPLVQRALPLLLVLMNAEVIEYVTPVHAPLRVYEIAINPPKGTTNNEMWAKRVNDKCAEVGLNSLIIRP